MKNTVLSIEELEKLLKTEEYQYVAQEKHYIKEFEGHNQWTSQKVLNLWEDMMKDGEPATQKEYIEKGLAMTKEFWFKDSTEGRLPKYTMQNGSWKTTYLQWNNNIEKAVKWRLSRMYESFMAEYSLLCIVANEFPDSKLLSSNEIDLVLGVDLVAVKDRKIVYIHITKDNKYARNSIEQKAKKTVYLKDRAGRKHYWYRKFGDSHIVFLYDLIETNKTKEINGHHIFKREYVVEKLEEKFKEDIDSIHEYCELHEFHDYLKKNKLVKKGIKKMFIRYDLIMGKNKGE